MNRGISRNVRSMRRLRSRTGDVGDDPARFANEKYPGSYVPRREDQFPESVESTAGNVGKIERCRPCATNSRSVPADLDELPRVLIEQVVILEWKASTDQC